MSDPLPFERMCGTIAEGLRPSARTILRARQRRVAAAAESANAGFPDPGVALLEALVSLIEARGAWESAYGRTLTALEAHEMAAREVNAPGLSLPHAGPWLRDHPAIREALLAPQLTPAQLEALPGAIGSFVAQWVATFEGARYRRDPGRSRLAAAG